MSKQIIVANMSNKTLTQIVTNTNPIVPLYDEDGNVIGEARNFMVDNGRIVATVEIAYKD